MYAMPNLVAGSRIVPELIQEDFTPERVSGEVVSLLTDRVRHAETTEALRRVKAQLGTPGASARAAEAILEVASLSPKPRRIRPRAAQSLHKRRAPNVGFPTFDEIGDLAARGLRVHRGRVALRHHAVPADFAQMARESELIVRGTVVNVQSQMTGPRQTIESVITLSVADTMKGTAGAQTVFRVPGGQVGRYRRVMIGAPEFTTGDEVILFLKGRAPAIAMPYGLSQVSTASPGMRAAPW